MGLQFHLKSSQRTALWIVHNIYDFSLSKKGCKEIDIAATLEHIRDQRGGMVQNRQQFEFCLMAVAEEVHAILKALPQQQPQQQ